MAKFKKVKYVYDDIETTLKMCEKIKALFVRESIYGSHVIEITANKRFLITFNVINENSTNM